MNEWRFIDSGLCPAEYNMALDEAIAISVRRGDSPPTLRFYGWERPSVSIGLFQRIRDLNTVYCGENNIPVVRRPTGGRAILHDNELTYSFSSTNKGDFSCSLLEAYRLLSIPFQKALKKIGLNADVRKTKESGSSLTRSPLCFMSTSYAEISFVDEKLIGSAQKRWTDGFLQQGSIPYTTDDELIRRVFGIDDGSNRGITGLSRIIPWFDDVLFKRAIKESFEEEFGVKLEESGLSKEEADLAVQLGSSKYSSHRWNHRR